MHITQHPRCKNKLPNIHTEINTATEKLQHNSLPVNAQTGERCINDAETINYSQITISIAIFQKEF